MNEFQVVKLPALLVANAAKLSLSEKNFERDNLVIKLKTKFKWISWALPTGSMVGKFDILIEVLKRTRDFALSYKGDESIVVSAATYKLLEKDIKYLGGEPLYA